jgi:hypothetical protein
MNPATDRAHADGEPHASIWSLGLVIAVSAMLAVLIEPLVPNRDITASNPPAHHHVETRHGEGSMAATNSTGSARTLTTGHR